MMAATDPPPSTGPAPSTGIANEAIREVIKFIKRGGYGHDTDSGLESLLDRSDFSQRLLTAVQVGIG